MRTKSQLLLESVECQDDGVNQIRELMERWKHRLTPHNLAIAERYAKGELRVAVEIAVRIFGDSVKFCALFERERLMKGDRYCEHFRGEGEFELDIGGQVRRSANKKQSVLVAIVQQMQADQVLIPSTVRLERVDHLYRLSSDSLYFSWRVGFVMLGTLADRECGMDAGSATIRENQLTHQMVEGSSEILEGVSDDKRQILRDRLALVELYDQITCLRLNLSDEGIRIGWAGEKPMNLAIQISDVMFGPFDFKPDGLGTFVHELQAYHAKRAQRVEGTLRRPYLP